jgi:hypothetical protein
MPRMENFFGSQVECKMAHVVKGQPKSVLYASETHRVQIRFVRYDDLAEEA